MAPTPQELEQQIERAFTCVVPTEDSIYKITRLRGFAREFALAVADEAPLCREQVVALTKIEEAVMWANAAIARKVVD